MTALQPLNGPCGIPVEKRNNILKNLNKSVNKTEDSFGNIINI